MFVCKSREIYSTTRLGTQGALCISFLHGAPAGINITFAFPKGGSSTAFGELFGFVVQIFRKADNNPSQKARLAVQLLLQDAHAGGNTPEPDLMHICVFFHFGCEIDPLSW